MHINWWVNMCDYLWTYWAIDQVKCVRELTKHLFIEPCPSPSNVIFLLGMLISHSLTKKSFAFWQTRKICFVKIGHELCSQSCSNVWPSIYRIQSEWMDFYGKCLFSNWRENPLVDSNNNNGCDNNKKEDFLWASDQTFIF